VVAKAEEVTEEPPKIVEIKEKKLVLKRKEIQMQFCQPVGPGPTKIVEEDNQIYNTAGIENLNFRVVWLNSTSM
jgi:protein TonB